MVPSEDAIAKFVACVPDADDGKAFVFLEVRSSYTVSVWWTVTQIANSEQQGAANIDAAIEDYLDNPEKYSQNGFVKADSVKHVNGNNGVVDESPPAYDTPGYHPSAYNAQQLTRRYRPHTNAVIEAAMIRAQDEVRHISTDLL